MDGVHPAVRDRIARIAEDPVEADRVLDGWLRRFTAVADRPLRRTVLASCLEEADDASMLGALHRLDARADGGDATCRWLAAELALTPSVLHALPYARRCELYVAARACGLDAVAARFLGDRRPQGADKAVDNPHLDASPGERTAAARGRDRLVLDRLLHDRDPRVVAALLDNPRVTERDVVRIAAMRPTAPEVLACVAAHPRWATRYRVRKALAFNPFSPSALARQVLPTLLRQDLRELADAGLLDPELRAEVLARLER